MAFPSPWLDSGIPKDFREKKWLNSYNHTKPLLQPDGVEGDRTAHVNLYVNST